MKWWVIELIFLCLNIVMGRYQAYRFDGQQKRINHTLWAGLYLSICVVLYVATHNYWLTAGCIAMHLPVFNTVLNFSRKPDAKPLFYTHPEDPQGSVLDKLWGKAYPIVFFASLIILFIIQMHLYDNP